MAGDTGEKVQCYVLRDYEARRIMIHFWFRSGTLRVPLRMQ
jgi:hypothetical protein